MSIFVVMKHESQQAAARAFATAWANRGDEKKDTQSFWLSLLRDLFDIDQPERYICFEKSVPNETSTGFIDGYIAGTRVLIEQKSRGVDLKKPQRQSNNRLLSPYEQAKSYDDALPVQEKARWIVTCNFDQFVIYDMTLNAREVKGNAQTIALRDLPREYPRLAFLVDRDAHRIQRETEISLQAGALVGRLYDLLYHQYHDIEHNVDEQRSLNMLCVRLVFCMYAEDAEVFPDRGQFVRYLRNTSMRDFRDALIRLFHVLNTPEANRDSYLNEELSRFPYVNGGLFDDSHAVSIPTITDEIARLIMEECCEQFDWSGISPTIFGAVFESTLNPLTRRSGGMHYTSVENIHKVIDPLCLDDLEQEYQSISDLKDLKKRQREARKLQTKIASLRYLDPACGSGNFLTETYLSLRRLENRLLRLQHGGHSARIAETNPIEVSISQFYGIEINDFAAAVANTALWISEAQMMRETEEILQCDLDFLPLKNYEQIHCANALTLPWSDVVAPDRLNYIIGNPPFVGAMKMDEVQTKEMKTVFPECLKVGEVDYVMGWYAKAARYIDGTNIRGAFVSTNSICQGQSVSFAWKPLFDMELKIDFAHRTFRWDSEASLKAHVHCVIVGFSTRSTVVSKRYIFDQDETVKATNINPYLVDAKDVFIESRSKPLCPAPPMHFGSMPRDGGGFILTSEERESLIKTEPEVEQWIRLYLGAEEFINGLKRYCLWLKGITAAEIRNSKTIRDRVARVQQFRSASKAAATRKFADTPTLFCQIAQPDDDYILVPGVSSERRRYIPMGFLPKEVIASNAALIIPSATLYHFGVLTSSVHMAWMRTVAGRLKSDYRYSKDIVYNNFPWPNVSTSDEARISATAQAILDAREQEPNSSLADLYDETSMPIALRQAHRDNDAAVLALYGLSPTTPEPEIVKHLMGLYQRLTKA